MLTFRLRILPRDEISMLGATLKPFIRVGSRKDLCVVFERGGAVNLLGDVSQLARRIV